MAQPLQDLLRQRPGTGFLQRRQRGVEGHSAALGLGGGPGGRLWEMWTGLGEYTGNELIYTRDIYIYIYIIQYIYIYIIYTYIQICLYIKYQI